MTIDDRKIDGIAFNFEGTTLNLEHVHHQGHVLAARDVGVILDLEDLPSILRLVPHFIGGPRRAVVEDIYLLSNKTRSREFIEARDKYFYRMLLDQQTTLEVREGFLSFLTYVQELGLETAMGSVTPRAEAWPLLEKSGLSQLYNPNRIILLEDVVLPKPNPDVYRRTAERMGIDPAHQLVFDDAPNGIRAATDAGSLAIAMPIYYDVGIVREDLVRAGAYRIYAHWDEVRIDEFLGKEGGAPGVNRERLYF